MYGILAEFDSAQAIYKACEKVRDAGFKNWDACTPFPVHGLEKAMGLKASPLPWLVLLAGVLGGTSAMGFMIWTSAFDYAWNIGGKPTWSIPAFIPIAFEFTILLAGLTTTFGMLALNRLPRHHHPLFDNKRFERVTDDKFFIIIESEDPQFDQTNVENLLKNTGATAIEVLEN